MNLKKLTDSAELFLDQVRLALNNYDDPQWLGESSPLAAPYFLGEMLNEVPYAHSADGRGRALQKAIQLSADSLWSGSLPSSRAELETVVQSARLEVGNSGNRYYFFLLDLRYLRRYFRPRADPAKESETAVRTYLGVGRGPYFNHLKAARAALGEALINFLQPTFRLENPPQLEGRLIGREDLIDRCLADLKDKRTIALTGMGGSGKTSLAAAIARRWSEFELPVFWFTLWPTVGNQVSSLLFSLGYFLHQQGASGLWLQLVANHGQLNNLHLALEQARGALYSLEPRPLLCIDEANHLINDPDKVLPAQQQLLSFLEGLRGLTPLLLIGQHVNVLADIYHTLEGLEAAQVREILTQNGVRFREQDLTDLQGYTGGNPRMVWLCSSLSRSGHNLSEILDSLPKTSAFQELFTHFWHYLTASERYFIRQIAVFRSPVPADAFPGDSDLMVQLAEQHILQNDGKGAITLLPIIRDLVYEDHIRLPAVEREKAHLLAAKIRAERGEFTAAAYHFVHAGEPDAAIQVWYPHRHQEIRRGQAEVALNIFAQLSQRRLSKDEANALALIKAQLSQLTGQTEQGLVELKEVEWQEDSEMAIEAYLLQGTFLNSLGYPQNALEKLEQGQTIITRLMEHLVRFRHQRAVIHIQQWQMADAIQEARLAQYTTEHLQGQIHEQQGNYEDAFLAYQRALVLARSINYDSGIAETSRDLATLLMRQSRLDEALRHIQEAMEYYDAVGDRLSWEKARNTLLGIHFQAGEFEEVIAIGEKSLPFFERAKIPYYAGAISSNLAESYYETGDFDKAEYYAFKTLSMEEAHPYPYALYTLGLVQRSKGNYDAAEKYLSQSREAAANNEDIFMEAYAERLLGEVLIDLGKPDEAEKSLRLALDLFRRLNIRPEIEKTSDLLGH